MGKKKPQIRKVRMIKVDPLPNEQYEDLRRLAKSEHEPIKHDGVCGPYPDFYKKKK